MSSWQRTVVVVAAAALSLSAVFRTDWQVLSQLIPKQQAAPLAPPREPVEIDRHLRGLARSAKVGVVEFADFQCPFCKEFARSIQPELTKEYVDAGRVLWSFRHLPLTSIHARARAAADLSECAGLHGRFWQIHDALFLTWQGAELTAGDLPVLLGAPPPPALQSCAGRTQPAVDADLRAARALGVTATPTFLVGPIRNGRLVVQDIIVGSTTLDAFRKTIEASLATAAATATR